MKTLKFLIAIILFTNILLAETHKGSFKLNEFRDKSEYSFDTNIKVNYEISTLMGEPVVKVRAKYTIGQFVDIDGKSYVANKLSQKKLAKLKIYDLKLRVPFETDTVNTNLYIMMDMGAMGNPGEWSYNTPGSPNWDKWIMYGSGIYLNKKEAINAYKGFKQLGSDVSSFSLATVTSITYDVSGAKGKKHNSIINGEWYRKKDNRLLSIQGSQAIYPNGSKGKWKGHSPKYKNIKYLGSNKWSCEEEWYDYDNQKFYWDGCTITSIDNRQLKVVPDNKNKITYWIKK